MDCSRPDFSVPHQLQEFAQVHVKANFIWLYLIILYAFIIHSVKSHYFFIWNLVHIQYCVSFRHTTKWYIYKTFWIIFPYGLLQNIDYSLLCYTVDLQEHPAYYISILYIVVYIKLLLHTLLYIFFFFFILLLYIFLKRHFSFSFVSFRIVTLPNLEWKWLFLVQNESTLNNQMCNMKM